MLRGTDEASSAITVDYATADQTAANGLDYTAASGTLSFAPGDKVKAFRIPILNAGLVQTTRNLQVTLSTPSGGATLGIATATVILQKNYCTVTPAFDDNLAIQRDDGLNILTWTGGGSLQRADKVTGPWQTLATAKSPYAALPPVSATFCRVTGARPVKLYVPTSYDAKTPRPLVIAMAGNGDALESTAHFQREPEGIDR